MLPKTWPGIECPPCCSALGYSPWPRIMKEESGSGHGSLLITLALVLSRPGTAVLSQHPPACEQ
eukprot:1274570-Pyramimonas_sp.AAC.1